MIACRGLSPAGRGATSWSSCRCLVRSAVDGEVRKITLGHPLLDDYLVFVAARARTNTWLAVAYDLKVFFEVVGKEPAVVSAADVFAFLSAQRAPRRGERVVRLEDGEAGPGGADDRPAVVERAGPVWVSVRPGGHGRAPQPGAGQPGCPAAGARRGRGGMPLIRTPRTLPRVLAPAEVNALRAASRYRPGPGHGGCDGAGRAAPLRSARIAAGGPQCWRAAAVRGRGQGRPSAGGAGLGAVLRDRGRLSGIRTARSGRGRAGVRGAERRPPRRAAVGGRAG